MNIKSIQTDIPKYRKMTPERFCNFTSKTSAEGAVDTKNKNYKLQKFLKVGALFALTAVAIGSFIKYKNNQACKAETNELYERYLKLLDENPEFKAKIENFVKNSPISLNIGKFVGGSKENYKSLQVLQYILLSDKIENSPQAFEIPKLMIFKKMESNSLACFIDAYLRDSGINVVNVSYDGNFNDFVRQIQKFKKKFNPSGRAFVCMFQKGRNGLGCDSRNSEEIKNFFVEFFKYIKDKKITFVTSDTILTENFEKWGIKNSQISFNYKVENIIRHIEACV